MSASLIGRLRSSAFRLSTTALSRHSRASGGLFHQINLWSTSVRTPLQLTWICRSEQACRRWRDRWRHTGPTPGTVMRRRHQVLAVIGEFHIVPPINRICSVRDFPTLAHRVISSAVQQFGRSRSEADIDRAGQSDPAHPRSQGHRLPIAATACLCCARSRARWERSSAAQLRGECRFGLVAPGNCWNLLAKDAPPSLIPDHALTWTHRHGSFLGTERAGGGVRRRGRIFTRPDRRRLDTRCAALALRRRHRRCACRHRYECAGGLAQCLRQSDRPLARR